MQDLNIRDRIKEFIKTLPEVKSVKAYGSSIAYQSGYKENEKKQVDLIVIVEDIKNFYKENLKKNKYMYKFTPKIYFKHAKAETLKKAAGICYTTDINYGIDTYKMGVIEKADVLDDLINWKTFYIAGRFQKEMFTLLTTFSDLIENYRQYGEDHILDKGTPSYEEYNETTLKFLLNKINIMHM